jgi:hypothetical protein
MRENKFKKVEEKFKKQRKKVREIISESKVMLFEIEEKRMERADAYRRGENSPQIEKEMEKLYTDLTEQYINFVEEHRIYDELLEQIYLYNKEKEEAEKAVKAEEKRKKLEELAGRECNKI